MFQLPLFKRKNPSNPFGRGHAMTAGQADKDGKPKRERRKKEPEKPWTLKDRLIVGGVLLGTMLLAGYFWYRGQGQVPVGTWLNFHFSWPSFEEKIILE